MLANIYPDKSQRITPNDDMCMGSDTLTVSHNDLKNKCVDVTCYPIVDNIGLNERSHT